MIRARRDTGGRQTVSGKRDTLQTIARHPPMVRVRAPPHFWGSWQRRKAPTDEGGME